MAGRFPALVGSRQGQRDELNFYNVVDNTTQVKRMPGLDMHGTDIYMSTPVDGGWVLLQDRDSEQLSLFNFTSLERIPVPPLDDDTENFTFSLPYPPSHPNSALVAVHDSKPYWLQFHPGREKPGAEFAKHTFHDDEFYPNNSTAYGGIVFVDGAVAHLIDPVSETVENVELRCTPACQYNTNDRGLGNFDFYSRFVQADGDLFKVGWCTYSDSFVLQSMDVFKLDLPNREWVRADTSDRVFFMGKSCSLVCSASATAGGIKDKRIYFVDDVTYEQLYCYDLDYGRLTTCLLPYPDNGVCACPCWVILDQDVEQQLEKIVDEEECGEESKELEVEVKKKLVLHDTSAAQEKSPCLLFTHKNDGEYVLVEPFTKSHRTLHLPELAGSLLYSSAFDGWLVVRHTMEVAFLFNLLTRDLIELPSLRKAGFLYHLALSSPPTSTDCMLFALARSEDEYETVKIIFCRIGDPEWTVLQFSEEHHAPFSPANTNAVFFKGLFHCLGRDGALGVYDHEKQTWTVLDNSRLEKEKLPFVVSQCCLVQNEDKLLSVFMDEYNSPRGVFKFEDGRKGWEKADDFGDGLLFVSRYSSILRPAPAEESMNLICLPKFTGENDYDLILIYPWDGGCFCNNTEYTLNPCWVEVSKASFMA